MKKTSALFLLCLFSFSTALFAQEKLDLATIEKIKEEGLSDDEAVAKMIEISNTPSLYRKFNFGKHKGRKVEDIFNAEPQYYDWMMQADFALHTKQKISEILNRMKLRKSLRTWLDQCS